MPKEEPFIHVRMEKTMSTSSGTFQAKKKDGSIYFRASITYDNKHISLGSFSSKAEAHKAYLRAGKILNSHVSIESAHKYKELSFEKKLSLINFRDNHVYFRNPIYMRKNFFEYYLEPDYILLFDIDDLFYYANHKIMRRGGHLFVADYGMQVTITGRYGIKPYAVLERDYRFINGNPHDFRYENIEILNSFHGVQCIERKGERFYRASIHINGNYALGDFPSAIDAAIAYNKAIDMLDKCGVHKNYSSNYIEGFNGSKYAQIYSELQLSPAFLSYLSDITYKHNQQS